MPARAATTTHATPTPNDPMIYNSLTGASEYDVAKVHPSGSTDSRCRGGRRPQRPRSGVAASLAGFERFRQAAGQVVEATRADEKRTQDHHRPALPDHLHGHRCREELTPPGTSDSIIGLERPLRRFGSKSIPDGSRICTSRPARVVPTMFLNGYQPADRRIIAEEPGRTAHRTPKRQSTFDQRMRHDQANHFDA